ncbi:MAG: hypothetical protein GQ566_00805 [Methanosarcinales archaeon]|nr:hypothetical protein [Methanosarcinales archaeon]
MTKKREDILYMTFRQHVSQHLEELKEFLHVLPGRVLGGSIFLFVCFAAVGLIPFSAAGLRYDFQPIYFLIGTAITLSGFTMLGGIFRDKNPSKEVKELFLVSIVFLTSASCFILFIGLFHLNLTGPGVTEIMLEIISTSAMFMLFMGAVLFIVGYLILMKTLLHYWSKIRE